MKVKYLGPMTGVTGLYDGGIYEVTAIREFLGSAMLQVVDEDQSDFNYDDDPNWKPGYLYSPTHPKAACGEYMGGKFYIVEDENGQLAAAGVPPLLK